MLNRILQKRTRRSCFRNEINEEEIRNIFTRYGTIKRFKFFEKDRKMALIEMDTIEQAIAALIVCFICREREEKQCRNY